MGRNALHHQILVATGEMMNMGSRKVNVLPTTLSQQHMGKVSDFIVCVCGYCERKAILCIYVIYVRILLSFLSTINECKRNTYVTSANEKTHRLHVGESPMKGHTLW